MLPIIHQFFGATLIIAGLIVLPLPLPFGLIMITLGCALLAPYVPVVQRLIRHMRSKWPILDEKLRRYQHRFPPVIKNTIDKTHPAE